MMIIKKLRERPERLYWHGGGGCTYLRQLFEKKIFKKGNNISRFLYW